MLFSLSLSPKSVYSLLSSVAGSSSSSSSSPNFPNCSSPRESASVFANFLKYHFSVSQPKTLRSRVREYRSELGALKSHSSFCYPFSPAEFLAAATNLSSSTSTGPNKVAYPRLKYLFPSGMDFFLHIFKLSWSLHSFPSISKTSSIIPIHKMGKPFDSFASSQSISLTSCVQSFLNASLYRVYSSIASILSPNHAGFRPGRSNSRSNSSSFSVYFRCV